MTRVGKEIIENSVHYLHDSPWGSYRRKDCIRKIGRCRIVVMLIGELLVLFVGLGRVNRRNGQLIVRILRVSPVRVEGLIPLVRSQGTTFVLRELSILEI